MTIDEATKQLEKADLNLINATNDYGHGSIQFKAALRAHTRAVKQAKLVLATARATLAQVSK